MWNTADRPAIGKTAQPEAGGLGELSSLVPVLSQSDQAHGYSIQ
eukprot:COSAG01_NODE_58703_length_304_cov_1.034146_1_plen_43_part_10